MSYFLGQFRTRFCYPRDMKRVSSAFEPFQDVARAQSFLHRSLQCFRELPRGREVDGGFHGGPSCFARGFAQNLLGPFLDTAYESDSPACAIFSPCQLPMISKRPSVRPRQKSKQIPFLGLEVRLIQDSLRWLLRTFCVRLLFPT